MATYIYSQTASFFFFLSLQNQAWKRLRTQKESSWGGSREFVISSRGKCVTREANGGGSAQVVQSSWPCRPRPLLRVNKPVTSQSVWHMQGPDKSHQAAFEKLFVSEVAAHVFRPCVRRTALPDRVLSGTQGCWSLCMCHTGIQSTSPLKILFLRIIIPV